MGKGDGFSPKVKEGDKVKKGDLLLEMDLDKIAAALLCMLFRVPEIKQLKNKLFKRKHA